MLSMLSRNGFVLSYLNEWVFLNASVLIYNIININKYFGVLNNYSGFQEILRLKSLKTADTDNENPLAKTARIIN